MLMTTYLIRHSIPAIYSISLFGIHLLCNYSITFVTFDMAASVVVLFVEKKITKIIQIYKSKLP